MARAASAKAKWQRNGSRRRTTTTTTTNRCISADGPAVRRHIPTEPTMSKLSCHCHRQSFPPLFLPVGLCVGSEACRQNAAIVSLLPSHKSTSLDGMLLMTFFSFSFPIRPITHHNNSSSHISDTNSAPQKHQFKNFMKF